MMPSTVKKTFEAAKRSGNALLAQVKGNQPNLLEALRDIAASQSPVDTFRTVDRKRHGRQEHRDVDTFDLAGHLGSDWNGLIVSAARVTRLTWHKDTKSGLWHATDEISFYVCQVALTAEEFANAIRSHWGIENRYYHVKDVTLHEDASRIRKKPGHFARLRSVALNVLRANRVTNVAAELYINALNFQNMLAYAVS